MTKTKQNLINMIRSPEKKLQFISPPQSSGQSPMCTPRKLNLTKLDKNQPINKPQFHRSNKSIDISSP